MTTLRHMRGGAAAGMLVAAAACAGLGNVLGGSGAPQQGQQGQISGTVAGVDTRAQQIGIQQSNGQTIGIGYDDQTRVVYQNQYYNVTNLEQGDQVTARVQSDANGSYYTDLVQVDQSVSNTGNNGYPNGGNPNGGYPNGGNNGGTVNGSVQSIQGTVTDIDRTNGTFTLAGTNYGTVTVSLPYNVSRTDANRFQSLRTQDFVRVSGVFLNNTRFELRQFY
jgi:hypothetical protein